MRKNGLCIEGLLELFVPGVILVFGAWSLHQPLLQAWLEWIVGNQRLGPGLTLTVLASAALCAGLLVREFSDVAVAVLVRDDADSEESRRKIRQTVRAVFRCFVFHQEADPRVKAVCRYLESPRNARFATMVRDWAGTDINVVRLPQELVACHQHVLARLRAGNADSRELVETLYQQVRLSAALFLASAWLLLLVILALVGALWRGAPVMVLLLATVAIYVVAIVAGHSLVRRFRHFCAQTLTLGMQVHATTAPTRTPAA